MARLLSSSKIEEQRGVVRFLWSKRKTPTEIHREMLEVYGGDCLNRSNISR